MRSAIVLLLITCAACVSSDTQRCGDGRVCPAGEVCDDAHARCVLPQQLAACRGVSDGTACQITSQLAGVCRDQVCVVLGCGDGAVVAPEQCDGVVPDAVDDCTEHGYHDAGAVRCTSACTIDTSQCGARCGDGTIDASERCDPGPGITAADDVLGAVDCLNFGFYAPDGLACSAACTIDVAACTEFCGDGVRNGSEACDGSSLGSVDDCTDLGFYQTGTVTCDGGCNYDTSACLGFCGNGIVDGSEPCDPGATSALGDDTLGGRTCLDFNFYQAAGLACSTACTFVTAGCSTRCGDGVLDSGEDCDAAGTSSTTDDVFGGDCRDLGFYQATTIGCTAACTYDTSACQGTCGDRVLDPVEACEGKPPAGKSCLDFGFDEGPLGCTALCAPDLSACRRAWITTRLGGLRITDIGGAAGEMFAVGDLGSIWRRDGNEWVPMTTGTSGALESVWVTSATHALAVGTAGTILRWTGSAWTADSSGSTANLAGVWAASTTAAFAVGNDGTILRKQGSVWSPVSSGTSNSLLGVWGSAENNVFAVGAGGTILRWNGTSWSPQTSPTSQTLNAVFGTGPNDVWAVGTGAIIHWNGTQWSDAGYGGFDIARDVWARSASEVIVVTVFGRILHFNGVHWNRLDTDVGDDLYAAWGDASEFMIGGSNGAIMRGTGRRWHDEEVVGGNQLWAINGVGSDDVFAVGNGGKIVTRGPLKWGAVTSGTSESLYDAWASSPGDAYAVGFNEIVHRDSTTWAPVSVATGGLTENVHGSGPSDVIVAGFAGKILHYDGNTWTTMTSGSTSAFFDVWSTAPGEAYVVGAEGTILRRTGTVWSPMSSPTSNELRGLWASGPRDLFAVGVAGTVLHGDGATWTAMPSPLVDDLNAVWGTGPTDVYASGIGGTVMRWDGTSWSLMRMQRLIPIYGGWAAAASHVYTVGSNVSGLLRTCAQTEAACGDRLDEDCDGNIDCGDADCSSNATCTAGGVCSGWASLGCGSSISGTTVGGQSRIDRYACGDWLELGRERVYRIVPPQSGSVTVSLTGLSADLDLAVLEANAAGACQPTFPHCRGVSSTTGNESLTFTAVGGQPYFIVVDGYGASRGAFTLAAACP